MPRNSLPALIVRPILQSDPVSAFKLTGGENQPLKGYLRKGAIQDHFSGIAKTFVLTESPEPGPIYAYTTLVCSEIASNEHTNGQTQRPDFRYDHYPAVKLARLAVSSLHQGAGIGKAMLEWSIGLVASSVTPNIGCRFLVLDAKSQSVSFYEKCGFTLLDTPENRSREHPVMFLDLLKASQS